MNVRMVRLGSIARITSGGTPDRENPAYWGAGVPWVKTSLIQNGTINLEDIDESITEEGLRKSSAKLIPAGSILIAMIGQGKTRGQAAMLHVEAAVSQNCAALILNPDVDSGYVYQQLLFHYEELRNASNSSGQANLNAALIRGFRIPALGLDQQIAVGQLLATWDSAIQSVERLTSAKLRELSAYRTSLFNSAPKPDWAPTRLSDVLQEHNLLSTGGEPVYSVSVRKGLINQIEHLGRSFAASNTSNYNLVRPNDLVYTKSPTGSFPFGIVKQSVVEKATIVSPLYGVFTPQHPDIGMLLDFFFESPIQAKNYLRPLIQKGAKNTISISNADFLSGKVFLPKAKGTRDSVTKLIRLARSEIELLRRHSESLRKQKRSLMQKLLTGQWRIPTSATKEAA